MHDSTMSHHPQWTPNELERMAEVAGHIARGNITELADEQAVLDWMQRREVATIAVVDDAGDPGIVWHDPDLYDPDERVLLYLDSAQLPSRSGDVVVAEVLDVSRGGVRASAVEWPLRVIGPIGMPLPDWTA